MCAQTRSAAAEDVLLLLLLLLALTFSSSTDPKLKSELRNHQSRTRVWLSSLLKKAEAAEFPAE